MKVSVKKITRCIMALLMSIVLVMCFIMPAFANDMGKAGSSDQKNGTCGASATWTFEDGVLTIAGSGEMSSYNNGILPWRNYADEISTVVINEGVTSIGVNAFSGLSGLKSVTIPGSVTKIGAKAFANCGLLTNVALSNYVKEIGDQAFRASGITSLEIPSSATKIGRDIVDLCLSLQEVVCNVSPAQITSRTFSTLPNGVEYDLYIYSRDGWTQYLAGCRFYEFTETTVYLDGVRIELEPGNDPGDVSGDASGDASGNAPGDAPHHNHTIVVDPAVEATCLKEGLTEGSHCSECGEVITLQKTIPAKGHIWGNGTVTKEATLVSTGVRTYKCINCPESRSEEIPRLKENRPDGIGNTPASDGNWYYFKDNQVAIELTTIAHNNNGWFYVENGKVNFSYTGLADNENGTFYVKGGKVDFNFKGLWKQEGRTCYLEGGQVQTGKTDVLYGEVLGEGNGESGWWNVVKGVVIFGPTLAHNSSGWWYIDKTGKVDFNYNGLGDNENGIFVVKDGKVDFSYKGFMSLGESAAYFEGGQFKANKTDVMNGKVNGEDGWWNVVNGIVTAGPTVASNSSGWWYIDERGKVDFNFKGLADNANGTWYCEGGQVKFGKSDVLYCSYDGESAWWNIVDGKLTYGETVASNSGGWWYIDKTGKVDFDANTVAPNANGWWYVKDGKVDFNYTGLASNANGTWYCKGGKVDFGFNGTYAGKTIKGGKVVG